MFSCLHSFNSIRSLTYPKCIGSTQKPSKSIENYWKIRAETHFHLQTHLILIDRHWQFRTVQKSNELNWFFFFFKIKLQATMEVRGKHVSYDPAISYANNILVGIFFVDLFLLSNWNYTSNHTRGVTAREKERQR